MPAVSFAIAPVAPPTTVGGAATSADPGFDGAFDRALERAASERAGAGGDARPAGKVARPEARDRTAAGPTGHARPDAPQPDEPVAEAAAVSDETGEPVTNPVETESVAAETGAIETGDAETAAASPDVPAILAAALPPASPVVAPVVAPNADQTAGPPADDVATGSTGAAVTADLPVETQEAARDAEAALDKAAAVAGEVATAAPDALKTPQPPAALAVAVAEKAAAALAGRKAEGEAKPAVARLVTAGLEDGTVQGTTTSAAEAPVEAASPNPLSVQFATQMAGQTRMADLTPDAALVAGADVPVDGLDDQTPAPASLPPATAGTDKAVAMSPATGSAMAAVAVETTAHLAAQIARRLEGRSTRFEMALTPDDLGRVDVSLDIDADGGLTARLAFDNPLAATELRGRADELRRQLQDAGFTVGSDALSFSEREAGSSGGGADRRFEREAGRAFAGATRLNDDLEAAAAPAAWISHSQTPQGVDLKV